MKFTNKNVFEAARHEIEASQCLRERKKNMPPIILDIRSKEEYDEQHLVGSYSFPEKYLKDNYNQIPPYAQIILYAENDDTATAQAVELLINNRFTDVSYVKGGIASLMDAIKNSADEIILSELPEDQWEAKIEGILDERIRPTLASDGGGLQVIKIEKDIIHIHYEGACHGCASAATGTLNFIKNTLSTSLNHEINVVMA